MATDKNWGKQWTKYVNCLGRMRFNKHWTMRELKEFDMALNKIKELIKVIIERQRAKPTLTAFSRVDEELKEVTKLLLSKDRGGAWEFKNRLKRLPKAKGSEKQ